MKKLLSHLAFLLLSLRYRIEFKGIDRLQKQKGTLFLSNHPSEIESLFFALKLWPTFRFRPIAVEYAFRISFLRPIMKMMRAIPVPKFSLSVNQIKADAARAAMEEAAKTLREGGSILLYPGGGLKSSAREVIGGASGAHTLLQEAPHTQVVLIRVTGLWGSQFSQAITGASPHATDVCLFGLKALFKNALFFLPRRKVTIEFEPNPADFPRGASRVELNRYLEEWYNRVEDRLNIVPYQFWSEKKPEAYVHKQKVIKGASSIPDGAREKIYGEIRRILESPELPIASEMTLTTDLGMDSLNVADLSAYLIQNFEVENFRPEDLASSRAAATVQDVLQVASGATLTLEEPKSEPVSRWPKEEGRPLPEPPAGQTLIESFFHVSSRLHSFAACGDATSGILSYGKMKRSVQVLGTYFKTWPEKEVAIMLPASVGAFVTILALLYAEKVPVMLNWTLGPRYLEEMMHLSGAEQIVTSLRFIDRVSQIDFGTLAGKMRHLETIRSQISWKTKLKGLFSRPPTLDPDSPAVLLFTSGSEALPKCVPLTHTNLLSNAIASFHALGPLTNQEANYSILPPFHSFGFNCAGLLPLLAGVKTTFYPDPTQAGAIAEGISQSESTLFAGPPTFMKRIFSVGTQEQLKTLRLYVSAAEKAPREVIERAEAMGGQFLEGYGATECSPVISLNRPELPKKGAGPLFPGFELITIHPETHQLLPKGKEGEICLRGPSVFKGYLGSAKNPFIEVGKQQWYRTGDLGYLDPEGYLHLSGRLKRFTKIGGEMISLGAIEEILAERLLKAGRIDLNTPSIAVSAKESSIVLFTLIPLEKEAANELLRSAGLSNLIKISSVKQVTEIPLMGTGKVDYRRLLDLYS